MSKVTLLPYESPRCISCGRNLPKGRKQKCYACRPPKGWVPSIACPSAPYTLNDRVAQAQAYGISYGNLMAIIESGGKLPSLKRQIMWPEGSAHAGE